MLVSEGLHYLRAAVFFRLRNRALDLDSQVDQGI